MDASSRARGAIIRFISTLRHKLPLPFHVIKKSTTFWRVKSAVICVLQNRRIRKWNNLSPNTALRLTPLLPCSLSSALLKRSGFRARFALFLYSPEHQTRIDAAEAEGVG